MNRNIIYLWVADTTSLFGSSIYTLALTLLSLHLTDSIFGAGATLFASTIPYLFIGILGGVISDRVNKKRLMIVCDICRGILTLSIPIALLLNQLTITHLIIVGILNTCFRAFFHPAFQSVIPELVTNKEDLTKVNSWMGTTVNLALMMGPSLGGILLVFDFNAAQLLYIDSATFFISALFIYLIKLPSVEQPIDKKSILQDSWEGIRFISVENKRISILMLTFLCHLVVGTGIIQLGVPNLLKSFNDGSSESFGFFLSAVAVGGAVSSIIFAQFRLQRHGDAIFIGYGLRVTAFLIMYLSSNFMMLLISGLVLGTSYTFSGIPMTTLLQSLSPRNMLGKVLAVRSTLGNVSDAFAFLIVGSLLSATSIPTTFLIVTIYTASATLVCFMLWKVAARNFTRNVYSDIQQ